MRATNLILVLIGLLGGVLALEQYTNIDVWLSNHIYDFTTQSWPITYQDHLKLSWIFYDGSKRLVTSIGTLCFIYLVVSIWKKSYAPKRIAVLTILLSTFMVSAIVGQLKHKTNVYCPNQLTIYQSSYPYTKLFDAPAPNFTPMHRGHCFPAGHVTGAFSLMSLCLLCKRRRNRFITLGSTFLLGVVTGGYQMLRGEHFFSHTLTSLVIASITIILLYQCIKYIFALKWQPNNKPATQPMGAFNFNFSLMRLNNLSSDRQA